MKKLEMEIKDRERERDGGKVEYIKQKKRKVRIT